MRQQSQHGRAITDDVSGYAGYCPPSRTVFHTGYIYRLPDPLASDQRPCNQVIRKILVMFSVLKKEGKTDCMGILSC